MHQTPLGADNLMKNEKKKLKSSSGMNSFLYLCLSDYNIYQLQCIKLLKIIIPADFVVKHTKTSNLTFVYFYLPRCFIHHATYLLCTPILG